MFRAGFLANAREPHPDAPIRRALNENNGARFFLLDGLHLEVGAGLTLTNHRLLLLLFLTAFSES